MDTSVEGLIKEAKRRINVGGVPKGLVPILEELIRRCKKRNVDVLITSGYRSFEEQAALYGQGRSSYIYKGKQYARKGNIVTNAMPGQSIHNYGIAFDFCIVKNGKELTWDTTVDLDHDGKADWIEVVEEAKKLGFSWGGDWKSFRDFPHIEFLGGLTYNQIFAGQKPKFPTVAKDYSKDFYTTKVKQVKAKTPISLYGEAEFKKAIQPKKWKKGDVIDIIGITKSKAGIPRFITTCGLITANRKYVEEVKPKAAAKPKPTYGSYTIKSGDSLTKIAKAYKTTVANLKKINNLKSDLIVAGKKLKVPK